MSNDAVLVLNAGSSSLKFSLFTVHASRPQLALAGQIEGLYTTPRLVARDATGAVVAERTWPSDVGLDHEAATTYLLDHLRDTLARVRLVAAGHRVVHGGTLYAAPVRIDAAVVLRLASLVPLAPLHQPHNLTPIRALLAARPDLPQVACFDTAFHRGMPEVAQAYALPQAITALGVRRYGFHGLSYEYIASVLPEYDAVAAAGRTVVAHLGNGASMCALDGGRSVASTMGFTALEGLPMGTRSGSLDPGVLLYLLTERGMDAAAIGRLLYHESGLLGVSGISSDMRALLASDDARAQFAIDLFVYRIARELGSLAAALGGIDALVFTAGIGEHAATIRERVLARASWLGLDLRGRCERRAWSAHLASRRGALGVGDPDRRGGHDRAAHGGYHRQGLTGIPSPRSRGPGASGHSPYRLLRELLLGERDPVARPDRQGLVVEVELRAVQAGAALAAAGAEPDVAAGLLLQHEGEVLAAHVGHRIGVDAGVPHHRAGRGDRLLRLLRRIHGRRVAPLVGERSRHLERRRHSADDGAHPRLDRSCTAGLKERTVPRSTTSCGITFQVSPPCTCVTLTTPASSGWRLRGDDGLQGVDDMRRRRASDPCPS